MLEQIGKAMGKAVNIYQDIDLIGLTYGPQCPWCTHPPYSKTLGVWHRRHLRNHM